jgi:hypothetical protein
LPAGDGGAKEHFWELRIWTGMCPSGWFRLLWQNRFAIHPTRWAMAGLLSFFSVCWNFPLWVLQEVFFGHRIRRTRLVEDPVFVLGHWRSGTTLLHELLVSDPRHTYPDTYASFCPNHFLFSRPWIAWWLQVFLPPKRPMDNMLVHWDAPQEDEWALCNMGIPSPYLTLAFPNHGPLFEEYLDLRDLPPEALAQWKEALYRFLQALTVQSPKRIVLKSPPHTARVRVLLEMFPQARFIHIVRDPYALFPSTMKTWQRLYRYHGLQVPHYEGLEEHVFRTLVRMYEAFEEDRPLIPPGQLCQVRYEDLVRDPVAIMQRIYTELDLGDFELARPAIEAYAARSRHYQVNRHELTPQQRAKIAQRWHFYFQRYGYLP